MKDVIGWFADFFTWVKDKMAFEETRQALISDLGLDAPAVTPEPNIPQSNIDSIKSYQQASNPDKQALTTVLSDIRAIITSLYSFFASFNLSPSQAVEFTHRALNLLALNYFRLRQPRLFYVAQLLGFIEDTGTPFLSGKVSWDRIVSLCTDGGWYLLKTLVVALDDEEEAQARSDFYFTALAVMITEVFKENGKAFYGWDAAPESPFGTADKISRRMLSAAFFSEETNPANGSVIKKQVNSSLYFLSTEQGGPGLFITLGGGGELESPLGDKWKVIFKMSPGALTDMTIGGQDVFTIRGPAGGPTDIRASLALQSVPDKTNRSFVLPDDSATHIEIGNIAFSIVLNSAEAEIKFALNDCALVIATKDNDGFLASLLPSDDLRVPFNFGIGAGNMRGLYTEGNIPFLSGRSTGGAEPLLARSFAPATDHALIASATGSVSEPPVPVAGAIGKGFSVPIPIGKSLGPVNFHSLLLKLAANESTAVPSDLAAEMSVALSLKLGPVFMSIDRLGFQFNLAFPESGGNLVFADLSVGPALPRGVAVIVESAAVTGGGFLFLDPEKGQYAGVVQLNLEGGIAVKGLGLIATRLPGNVKGFSLLIIITVEDFEPIPLPLGFRLTGIGGLLAINRTFDEEALRAGLKNHTLDSVMFPKDPIRNAPQILSNLNRVFPPVKGHHLFGPMAQIAWGAPTTLITADLGIVLELGARLRLLILAQVVAILPKRENDLVRLQMDAIGVLDFDQGTAELDATLYDSRLLKKFVLTGDMAMRLKWESPPNFALAIGGLHPAFNPPPKFPKLERIAINLAAGDNPRLRCEAYFALTANTVQFGARAELYASAHGFSIQGETGFDVLIQFDPFYFMADFYAQLQLKRGSTNLFKVRVEGALAGPRPLHIKAKATFEILWWDVSIRIDKTLVEGELPPPPEPVNVLPQLKEALGNPGNWMSQLPDGQRPMVTLRSRPGADVLLHPLGILIVKQNVVPLNMDISRFGQAAPAGARRFEIKSVSLNGHSQTAPPVKDFFAPAQFFEMSDDEKLSRPSFEPMAAGVSIGSGEFVFSVNADDWLEVEAIEFETIIVDKQKNEPRRSGPKDLSPPLSLELLLKQALFGAAGNSELRRTGKAKYRTSMVKHRIAKEGWSIVATADLSVQSAPGIEAGKPATYSEAAQALRKMKQENPAKTAGLKILRLSELSEG